MQNPFRRNIILFVCCLLGGILLPFLSLQLNPSPRSQSLQVSYRYPQAGPEVVEQEVSARLESAFATMRGLEHIKSISDIGAGRIHLTFNRKADIEKKRLEIAMLIRQIYPYLSKEVSYPEIRYQSEFEEYKSLLVYTLASDWPAQDLTQLVNERIITPLVTIPGLHDIELVGIRSEEFRIILNERLQVSLGLTTDDIQAAIRQQSNRQELGLVRFSIYGKDQMLAVRFGAAPAQTLPEQYLASIPLARRGERTIYLSDLAVIQKTIVQPSSYFRINGQPAATLIVYADQKTNHIRLAKEVRSKIVNLQTDLGEAVRLDLVRDETEFLSKELQKIAWRTSATFILLLLFIALVRPNARYLLLIWSALGANLLLSVLFYYGLGLELHLYSIAGWTLSIGIVLDNLIVMADHIRYNGNQRIFPAILAATLSTIGALSVIFFIEAENRESLTDFSGIFMVNLLVSLLVALLFLPALYRTLLSNRKATRSAIRRKRRVVRFTKVYEKFIRFSSRIRGLYWLAVLLAFGLPLFLLPDKWEAEHSWARAYNCTLGSEFYQTKLRPNIDRYLGGTLRLFHQKKDEFYFKQEKQEKTKLFVRAKMPFGGTTQQLNEVIQAIEAHLAQYKEIDKYQTRISGPDESFIEITFEAPYENGAFPYQLKSRLESLAIETGSADFSVYGVGMGFNNEVRGSMLSVQIQLLGYNYEALWRLAHSARERFLQHLRIQKAFVNAEPSYFEPREEFFRIELPPIANLQRMGMNPSRIGKLLRDAAPEKGTATFINWEGSRYPVNLYGADEQQNQLWDLRNRPHLIDSNLLYKHDQYLELQREKGQQKIVRLDQEYQLILAYDFIGNQRLGKKVLEQKLDSLSHQFPLGYTIRELGRNRFWNSSSGQSQLVEITLAALLVIFLINATLLNSVRQALIPLLLIPPAFIGTFLCVIFFDFRFDQGGFASFLLVAGLSVNAALFVINDYNHYRRSALHLSDLGCFLKAFNIKIIPILLTLLSTILGLLPFLIFDAHQPFWYSLAICTISGLIFSTLALYIIFPVFLLRNKSRSGRYIRFFGPKAGNT